MATKVKKEKRFDHYFKSFQHDGALLQRHTQMSAKEMRLAKACAYRMAKAVITMQSQNQNELLSLIESEGKTVDQWLDHWFAPIDALGQNHRELLTAVSEGLTLKKYLSTTPAVFMAGKRREVAKSVVAAPVPSVPDRQLTIEEQLAQWRDRANTLELQLREERSLRRVAEKRLAELESSTKKAYAQLDRVCK